MWRCEACQQRWVRSAGVLSFFNRIIRQGRGRYGEIMARRWLLAIYAGGFMAILACLAAMAATRQVNCSGASAVRLGRDPLAPPSDSP